MANQERCEEGGIEEGDARCGSARLHRRGRDGHRNDPYPPPGPGFCGRGRAESLGVGMCREEKSERRVATILLSLPGVGPLTAATALAESFGALQRGDYNALRGLYGVAPVTKQSGRSRIVMMRYSCVWRLRTVWHHAAMWAQRKDPRLHALYVDGRLRGHSIGRLARHIGDRLLAIAVHLIRQNELYNPALRTV